MAWLGLGLVVIAVGLGAHGHFTSPVTGAGYQTGVAEITCLKVQLEGSGVLEAAAKQTVRATVGGNVARIGFAEGQTVERNQESLLLTNEGIRLAVERAQTRTRSGTAH